MTDLRTVANIMTTKFGVTITVYNVSSVTIDNYGQDTITWDAGTNVKAISDQPTEEELRKERQGEIVVGRKYFFVPYDTSITVGDKVTYDSVDWEVSEVNKYSFFDKSSVIRVAVQRITD